jgi:predicted nucleotide-binding protein (sugar kinase/HSP70/actin superfamily)
MASPFVSGPPFGFFTSSEYEKGSSPSLLSVTCPLAVSPGDIVKTGIKAWPDRSLLMTTKMCERESSNPMSRQAMKMVTKVQVLDSRCWDGRATTDVGMAGQP